MRVDLGVGCSGGNCRWLVDHVTGKTTHLNCAQQRLLVAWGVKPRCDDGAAGRQRCVKPFALAAVDRHSVSDSDLLRGGSHNCRRKSLRL